MNQKYKDNVLKTLIYLSIPTILEQLLSTLLQYVDTAMVGHLGEQATASVSITTTISWLVGSISSAFGVAVLAIISRSIGENDINKIKEMSKLTARIVFVVGFVLTIISISLSPFIPAWMQAEEGVRKQAGIYFFIISIPLVFRAASTIYGAAIRAAQDTKTPMIINMLANILNVILNYIFIYVFDLGVTGAAIGSALSYVLAGTLMYMKFKHKNIFNYKRERINISKELISETIKLTTPVLGTSIVSCLGYTFFAGMVSGMGTVIFDAHSIAVTAETIFYIPGYGIRTATSAMIGLAYGEGDSEKYNKIKRLSILITVGMMFVTGLTLFFVSYPLMTLFTNSSRVATLGADMLKLVAFSEPFFGLMVVSEGIYYGLGKTKYPFVVESVCMWGIRLLFTFLGIKFFDFGLREVWFCMIADNVTKAIMLFIPLLKKSLHSKC